MIDVKNVQTILGHLSGSPVLESVAIIAVVAGDGTAWKILVSWIWTSEAPWLSARHCASSRTLCVGPWEASGVLLSCSFGKKGCNFQFTIFYILGFCKRLPNRHEWQIEQVLDSSISRLLTRSSFGMTPGMAPSLPWARNNRKFCTIWLRLLQVSTLSEGSYWSIAGNFREFPLFWTWRTWGVLFYFSLSLMSVLVCLRLQFSSYVFCEVLAVPLCLMEFARITVSR